MYARPYVSYSRRYRVQFDYFLYTIIDASIMLKNAHGIRGLYYIEDYISEICDCDQLLKDVLAIAELKPLGDARSRRVAHYGHTYQYKTGKLDDAPLIPDLLADLPNQVDITENIVFDQVIINEYKHGQNIAPHVDSRIFGPAIACISLGAPSVVTFERGGERIRVNIAAGSMYVMTGDARYLYSHSISHTGATRYSITYRTIN